KSRHRKKHKSKVKSFKQTEAFKNSEAVKIEGEQTLVMIEIDDGSVILNAANPVEKFENAIIPFEDWKKDNNSPDEERKYNKLATLQITQAELI
ncbi:MAG: hypothetical protein KOO69_01160, partial [Victivallales bacterium]|nr:hypothetical protein [Victivallales bacterium]